MFSSRRLSASGDAKVIRLRKRVLVVNCYFDDSRLPIRRTIQMPRPTAPAYLAGAFSPALCDIRLYDEMHSGPLENEQLLAWPDLVVLTGLTTAFDRMLHVTAYARTKNERVIVVAGGPAIRALPEYSRRFFDYCCTGDMEQLKEVIAEAFGRPYVAEEMIPRFDLAYWIGNIGELESSRHCNFRCSFCSLTGEGMRYRQYDLGYIRRQILALGKREFVLFVDNNFFGNDRNYFLARVQLIKELWRKGHFRGWGALVTNDFFLQEENLQLVHDAGCVTLFSGVESFDAQWLHQVNKVQNTHLPQVEMIQKCLSAGIVFLYGLMLDVTTRSVAALRRELDFIVRTPEITLPGFVTTAIPILGTPFFYACLAKGLFLPETRLRDLDGTTLSLRPLDPVEDVVEFLRQLQSLSGYKARILRHSWDFFRRYRSVLTTQQMALALMNGAVLCAHTLATAPGCLRNIVGRRQPRTYVSTTEAMDSVYKPAFAIAPRYANYFKPTTLIDKNGELSEDLADDLCKSGDKKDLQLAP